MKKPVISILSFVAGAVFGICAVKKVSLDKTKKMQLLADKHLALFLMMNQWVRIKQEGRNLASYFEKNGYKKVAIYGMSYVGETLADELKAAGIVVAYGIDKRSDSIYVESDMDIVTIDEPLEKVDAIVVTAITFFDEIEKQISERIDCPILSLQDILHEV